MGASAIAVKEKPILFSGPMVRAILEGRKTQTRRVVKPQPQDMTAQVLHFEDGIRFATEQGWIKFPYDKPGDRLWVRETFWNMNPEIYRASGAIYYKASSDGLLEVGGKKVVWSPSLFMQRWASRITLEILSVRVERIQDLSGRDVLAEGAVLRAHKDGFGNNAVSAFDGKCYLDLVSLWASGWDQLNKKRGFGWHENPWVWVIDFKRV